MAFFVFVFSRAFTSDFPFYIFLAIVSLLGLRSLGLHSETFPPFCLAFSVHFLSRSFSLRCFLFDCFPSLQNIFLVCWIGFCRSFALYPHALH